MKLSKTEIKSEQHWSFLNKHQAAKLVQISHHTLSKYRLSGKLIQGLHWHYINSRTVKYNEYRLREWLSFNYDTEAQLKSIENSDG